MGRRPDTVPPCQGAGASSASRVLWVPVGDAREGLRWVGFTGEACVCRRPLWPLENGLEGARQTLGEAAGQALAVVKAGASALKWTALGSPLQERGRPTSATPRPGTAAHPCSEFSRQRGRVCAGRKGQTDRGPHTGGAAVG